MKNIYKLSVACLCPVDQQPDDYRVRIESERTIPVEQILKVVNDLSPDAMYQEDFTSRLARDLAASVKTVGYHSGVKTICIR